MKKFWIVLKKELKDCFRDKRSIAMMLLPLMVFPILLTFFNKQIESADESVVDCIVVACDNETEISEIVSLLSVNGTRVEISDSKDATTDLKSGKLALIIHRDENGYQLIYDRNSIKSSKV